ncbi:MAG: hypothetical protein RPT94_11120 [Candidatus Sedimenticola sp. (ex Thyasira tokunagai)]
MEQQSLELAVLFLVLDNYMNKWYLNTSSKLTKFEKFKSTSKFYKQPLDLHSTAIHLRSFLQNHPRLSHEVEQLDAFSQEQNLNRSITLYDNNDFEENFILGTDKKLYVRQFFFQTLTPQLEKEFNSFVFFQIIFNQLLLEDLVIYLASKLSSFLDQRKKILMEEEFIELYKNLNKSEIDALLGLLFTSLIHYQDYLLLNQIEKKILKEIFFPKKIKKILGLNENDYKYLQKTVKFHDLSEQDQLRFNHINNEIEKNKILLIDYADNKLKNKKILFWCMWAVSPFLVRDINRLFGMINQSKKITKVYLDLPTNTQETIKKLLSQTNFKEYDIETEIKKIYPRIIDDYAMETLPYLKILERIHYYKIPINCFGIDGEDMIRRIPNLKNEKLIFNIDPNWQKQINHEYSRIDQMDLNELVIFFYFLKPMYPIPTIGTQHLDIETLIHTDQFTGFGPSKFENSLSLFSRYSLKKSNSFILTNLRESVFNEEPIIFFPYQEKHFFKLDDSLFNRFSLYNSLLYSTTKGNGGNGDFDLFTNFIPQKSRITS